MTVRRMKLGELFRIGSSKRVLQSQWKTEGVPFYRGREITRLAENGFVDNELFISEELYSEYRSKSGVPVTGDIMITAIGTIGNSYVVREDDRFYFKDASVLWLHRTSDVSSEFINYWLKAPLFLEQLDRGNGATVDTLTIQKLQSVEVGVPSLTEQRRIVAILDEAFEGIATAKANAEKNLQNAHELFENAMAEVFRSASPNAASRRLGELASFRNGVNYTQGSRGQKVRIFGVKDFKDHFWAPLEGLDEIQLDGLLSDADAVAKHDILAVRSNGNPALIGRTVLVPDLVEPMTHSGFTIRIRLHDTGSLPDFVCHYLKSPEARRTLVAGGNGANIKSLNQGTLSALSVPLPSLDVQQAIVAQIETLRSEVVTLEDVYERKLAALDELKKSLLHQAFSGQL